MKTGPLVGRPEFNGGGQAPALPIGVVGMLERYASAAGLDSRPSTW